MADLALLNQKDEGGKISLEVLALQKRLYEIIKKDEKLNGTRPSMSFVILNSVATKNYERAQSELDLANEGLEDYKDFERRARKFLNHAKSLVMAIKTKYEVCASDQVSKNIQKELADAIVGHFSDLRKTLMIVEKIQKNVRSADMSASGKFLQVFYFCIVLIFTTYVAFFLYPELKGLSNVKPFSYFEWDLPQ